MGGRPHRLLSERAETGALPERSGERRPLTWQERATVAVVVAACSAELVLTAMEQIPVESGVFLLVMTPLLLSLSDMWDRWIENPRFRLAHEGTASGNAGRKPWLSLRVRDWLRERPAVNYLLGVLTAIAVNKFSELL